MANPKLDLSRLEFEDELSKLGWAKEPGKDGEAMNYMKDGAKHSVRDDATSTLDIWRELGAVPKRMVLRFGMPAQTSQQFRSSGLAAEIA